MSMAPTMAATAVIIPTPRSDSFEPRGYDIYADAIRQMLQRDFALTMSHLNADVAVQYVLALGNKAALVFITGEQWDKACELGQLYPSVRIVLFYTGPRLEGGPENVFAFPKDGTNAGNMHERIFGFKPEKMASAPS
jgi:hypothetical protein